MGDDESDYEKEVRKQFWLTAALGPAGPYLGWRDIHRSILKDLAADPRVSPEALAAVKERL